ncbi:MAG: membrane protein insertase YidC [Desulfurivibrionaceae bacterium]|nr:membrane protein insertase YidC [Desulfurivibrionaceae bacterium]
MESKNAFLAILLSMAVLFGYQLLFPPQQPTPPAPSEQKIDSPNGQEPPVAVAPYAAPVEQAVAAEPARPARDIEVTTGLYSAVVSETGGTIKSFRLNEYRQELDADSPRMELVRGERRGRQLPLFFSWGADPATVLTIPLYEAALPEISTSRDGRAALTMTARLPGDLSVIRTMTFNDDNYLVDLVVEVVNNSDTALQGAPYLSLPGHPFTGDAQDTRFLFNGPAVLIDDSLEEIKVKDLAEDGPVTLHGDVTWTAYEDTYFMMAVAPEKAGATRHSVRLAGADGNIIENILFGPAEVIIPGGSRQYRYTAYIGPKKMAGLKAAGHDFDRAINFGWFGFVAKPVLLLLNLIHKYFHNYGVAIILVTVLIKLFFWPITQKGMKSMKNMQKLQPKLAKIREKYKGDKERLAQEQMKMYQTHKINPLGGCLPMVLQIPVFFALYRVLMQAIELRHAPFMLWINDLSAPERLSIGFELPYLGGLPLLTLLMGGSMFLQQKMTPTPSANPEMARMMMFMPVIFTFIFINFASGLVLYFFVNNFLQMAQQYYVNKDRD